MADHKRAYDGSIRRRIHLFRHGDVSYVTEDGTRVGDERLVPLTLLGQEQARAMGQFLGETPIDRAVYSGLRRTKETAEGILSGRDLPLIAMPDFEEIIVTDEGIGTITHMNQVAYAYEGAEEPGARFLGGELYDDFKTRIFRGIEELLSDQTWSSAALVAHGGTNRVILGWALGLGLASGGVVDQNMCCLNIIDVDTHPDTGAVVRKMVRGMNITTYDPTRQEDHLTTLESLAKQISG